ncbi:hypothetical protein BHE74_00009077 [Ensete ventricosum]|nr:hypothetical protein BHE74_00009077 [Ensete ventricosum]
MFSWWKGGSGVGIGNFQEIGPLDTDLKPRKSTWLQKADLLFVVSLLSDEESCDNPVGTGFSYVEDDSLFVRTDVEAAVDLTTLLKKLYGENESWRNGPLFIVAESYGGKYAVTVALTIVEAIKAGELKLKLGGKCFPLICISLHLDIKNTICFSHGGLYFEMSQGLTSKTQTNQTRNLLLSLFFVFFSYQANIILQCCKNFSIAERIRQQIEKGQFEDATNSWSELETFIASSSNNVVSSLQSEKLTMKAYPTYLSSKASNSVDISSLMDGVIREKLKIIPKTVPVDQPCLSLEMIAHITQSPAVSSS